MMRVNLSYFHNVFCSGVVHPHIILTLGFPTLCLSFLLLEAVESL